MTNGSLPGKTYWGIAGIGFVWNLLGFVAYWSTVTLSRNDLQAMAPGERAFYENLPAWVTSAFAIAVVCGLLGSLALMMRRRWALPMFLVSLVAVIVHRVHTFFLTDFVSVMGVQALALPILVLLIALFLVIYSRYAGNRGWLL